MLLLIRDPVRIKALTLVFLFDVVLFCVFAVQPGEFRAGQTGEKSQFHKDAPEVRNYSGIAKRNHQ